jgi:exodeoxyribonuclease-1
MSTDTLYWYDLETFGADVRSDRVCQFAGIRTDQNLNILGNPLVIYCRPANDFLPSPFACLVTGITPQTALSQGVIESDFTQQIIKEFSVPRTCVVGYNNISFDDELMRRLLYRNFFDPYEREYMNGNSRWDIIDMVRLCGAARPDGINWPRKESGAKSFKLDELTVANDIEHRGAHDALADVLATINMARLIKEKQPRLYDHVFTLRKKHEIETKLDCVAQKPVLHVSMHYSSMKGCLGLVVPLCLHPTQNNKIIVYNLDYDPSSWVDLDHEALKERIKNKTKNPIKVIKINSCPIFVDPQVLSREQAQEFGLDINEGMKNARVLQNNRNISNKIKEVFKEERLIEEKDPDLMIYSGKFFNSHDKKLMEVIRDTKPDDLARLDLPFNDPRLPEMFFRYRARNFIETLSEEELKRWNQFRRQKLHESGAVSKFADSIKKANDQVVAKNIVNGREVLLELKEYVHQITESLKL